VKSQELTLLQWLLEDLQQWCNTSTARDLRTIADRVEHEGMSFLTITLPDFCKDFERCLSAGQVSASDFCGFKKSGCLPSLLRGFTGRVFDAKTGKILDEPDHHCIFAVRQVTLLFSKILLPCSGERTRAALRKYVQTDKEVELANAQITSQEEETPFDVAVQLLYSGLFAKVERELYHGQDRPRHGPGATADNLRANDKFKLRQWTERLNAYFPFEEYVVPSLRFLAEVYDEVTLLPPEQEIPVRVTPVPKTLRTPRIIAIEPTAMQYVQQGLMEMLVEGIESSFLDAYIGFSDQEPNQRLAEKGSRDETLATLDLSEASDRVPNELVNRMLRRNPWLLGAVQACRSTSACVPGYDEAMPLAKFASMGSALCFPVEALCFTAIAIAGIAESRGVPVTRRLIREMKGQVRVYGDDIIVPVDCVNSVIESLEDFGFQVNSRKSFWTGRFRESCGKEYYNGHDVSIVRCRRMLPSSRSDHRNLISLIEFRNLAYGRGLWVLAARLDEYLGKLVKHYPVVHQTSDALARHSWLPYEGERMCPNLQRPLVRAYVVKDTIPVSELDGVGALLKYFLKRGDEPLERSHLRRSGRAVDVRTKLRWVSPY